MASQTTYISNKEEHDKVVAESATTPTIIYLSNYVLPICKDFTPKYEALAKRYRSERSETSIRFTQMETTPETSPMFKFAPNQLPVVILLSEGRWCRTLMSPTIKELEAGIGELLERVGKWKN